MSVCKLGKAFDLSCAAGWFPSWKSRDAPDYKEFVQLNILPWDRIASFSPTWIWNSVLRIRNKRMYGLAYRKLYLLDMFYTAWLYVHVLEVVIQVYTTECIFKILISDASDTYFTATDYYVNS